ncbi:hypothetical protein GCM10027020_25050 [Nocardioides salsibiostraticola]
MSARNDLFPHSPHASSSAPFGTLVIDYDTRVLEPRPWTIVQSLWAVQLSAESGPGRLLELCAGAGQIGLLAAKESGRGLVAVDLNPVACQYARHNAAAAGLADRVEVREGDFADVLQDDERFIGVIADPPWVTSGQIEAFPEDPTLAIDGGEDGLSVARACLITAAHHLVADGFLLLQLGDDAQCDRLVSELSEGAADSGAARWEERGRRAGERGVILGLGLGLAAE